VVVKNRADHAAMARAQRIGASAARSYLSSFWPF
jgi:hypothetical protein